MRGVVFNCPGLVAIACMAALSAPAWGIDPLTLIILRLVRDRVISSGVESAVEQANNSPTPNTAAAPPSSSMPYGMDPGQLRRLIDEGFVHLSSAQRDEIYAAMQRILADPKNAAQAPAIVADLAIKASVVREAYERINRLSGAEKRRIAAEAREEYERTPAEDREQLAAVLRARMVPLPNDLNDMILDEFARVPPAAVPLAATASAAPAADSAIPATPSAQSPGVSR